MGIQIHEKMKVLDNYIEIYGNETEGIKQYRAEFQNLFVASISGPYNRYGYKSFGSIIHWVYVYTSMISIADTVTVGDGTVLLYGKPFATYVFDEDLQIPVFSFESEHPFNDNYYNRRQATFMEGMKSDVTEDIVKKFSKYFTKNNTYGLS